ncbi:LysR family transcriptional regulator, repressor for citA [Gracilibacillus ureilyticus]|uniref:LysR family transcriptional regulator, repressor for citA n=1 Tax=Gracilibacillus ureilyticus TaxID=531814 RepID=A0A1H9QBN2_9BACI|nr:LysR family transcriptional regulator [Gracilibacillus ureilyticus]SER57808.1 LysR family transcriptional regulator, repressor for citA [Gracilibacillus ureilyticus]
MDMKWIKTFVVAAKYENFRKSSEELFLSQPAVTKHVKRLEEHLHSDLFDRTGKIVKLTAAGKQFLPYAKELLAAYEKGITNFESWKQGYSRKLIIAAAPQIASSFLPELLSKFMNIHPDIEVLVNVKSSFEIGEEIYRGDADIGLSRIEPLQNELMMQIIQNEPVILVGPAKRQLTEAEALNNYRLITHNHPEYWDTLLIDIKRYFPGLQTMVVNQMEVTKRFIESGLGVSYLPVSIVRNEMEQNKLLEIKSKIITPPISRTYILTKIETSEAKEFISFLRKSI